MGIETADCIASGDGLPGALSNEELADGVRLCDGVDVMLLVLLLSGESVAAAAPDAEDEPETESLIDEVDEVRSAGELLWGCMPYAERTRGFESWMPRSTMLPPHREARAVFVGDAAEKLCVATDSSVGDLRCAADLVGDVGGVMSELVAVFAPAVPEGAVCVELGGSDLERAEVSEVGRAKARGDVTCDDGGLVASVLPVEGGALLVDEGAVPEDGERVRDSEIPLVFALGERGDNSESGGDVATAPSVVVVVVVEVEEVEVVAVVVVEVEFEVEAVGLGVLMFRRGEGDVVSLPLPLPLPLLPLDKNAGSGGGL